MPVLRYSWSRNDWSELITFGYNVKNATRRQFVSSTQIISVVVIACACLKAQLKI